MIRILIVIYSYDYYKMSFLGNFFSFILFSFLILSGTLSGSSGASASTWGSLTLWSVLIWNLDFYLLLFPYGPSLFFWRWLARYYLQQFPGHLAKLWDPQISLWSNGVSSWKPPQARHGTLKSASLPTRGGLAPKYLRACGGWSPEIKLITFFTTRTPSSNR